MYTYVYSSYLSKHYEVGSLREQTHCIVYPVYMRHQNRRGSGKYYLRIYIGTESLETFEPVFLE